VSAGHFVVDARGPIFDLTPFEIATGLLYGAVPDAAVDSPARSWKAALEDAIRPALSRRPCGVAFSGGRDSSALLAVAIDLARREGWPEPVPITVEYEAAAAREQEWQEAMVAHLGIRDWVRIPSGDLDMVGPVAQAGLRRHGLLYPANAHTIVPMAEQVREGSLLGGLGGDDVFGRWPFNDVGSVLAGRRSPRARDLKRLVRLALPDAIEAEIRRRREPVMLPWLREPARRDLNSRIARELASQPRTWRGKQHWNARWRTWRVSIDSIARLAADQGVMVYQPFLEPRFLDALGRDGGRWGWGNRTETMRALFSDLLPEWMIERRTKAEFSDPLFGVHTKSFAQTWDGRTGIDDDLVDPGVLRQVWSAPQPHFLSSTALQAAWLATHAALGGSGPAT
jgi:hypothetical protein